MINVFVHLIQELHKCDYFGPWFNPSFVYQIREKAVICLTQTLTLMTSTEYTLECVLWRAHSHYLYPGFDLFHMWFEHILFRKCYIRSNM